MSASPSVAIIFHRLGPYHLARCVAAGSRCDLTVIELSSVDDTYAWSRVDGAPNFTRVALFADEDVDRKGSIELWRGMHRLLAAIDPEVVAIPGWSHPGALSALLWCVLKGRPAVLMSDSAAHDAVRRRAWEATKQRVVRLFSSAVVAGAPHSAYARALGLSPEIVFDGYDVVDNQHFARGARQARLSSRSSRQRLGLPERFFLASARFIAKKNLLRLLAAYAAYRRQAGADAWHLVLLGDGDLRAGLERRIAEADLAGHVILPGFRHYDELPAYYGLADAFVHASTTEQWGLVVNEAMASGLPVLVAARCGCVPDLVKDGVNGFTFDPDDVDELAGLMRRVAAMTDAQRQAMGRAGQRIIAGWGPERFADGLIQAALAAMRRPEPPAAWFDQALLWALAHRPR
jgi:hypothetical protein